MYKTRIGQGLFQEGPESQDCFALGASSSYLNLVQYSSSNSVERYPNYDGVGFGFQCAQRLDFNLIAINHTMTACCGWCM